MQYLSAIFHPEEFISLIKMGYARSNAVALHESRDLSQNLKWCYEMLEKTSRSFAFVIQELTPELRDVICVFYLVLRGVDTIEDDMSVDNEKKVPLLIQFHEKLLQPGWNVKGYGENEHEKSLVENFDKVIDVYHTFQEKYQMVIKDITKRMGAGMAEFCQRSVVTVPDYDLYCHYVAGLVGIGLSDLFYASGLEVEWFSKATEASNSMGLFLQKVNITRDYLEDINQVNSRIFWPKDIWSKYVKNLEDFKKPQYAKEAVYCLNDMITNALEHMPDCLEYLSRLQDKTIFNFCAIPQVMAIATLATCYNNHDVFTGVVKVRRGQTAKIMVDIHEKGLKGVYENFLSLANQLGRKIQKDDPNAKRTTELIEQIRKTCEAKVGTPSSFGISDVLAVAALAASGAYLVTKHNKNQKVIAKTITTASDVMAVTSLATSSAYLVSKHNKKLLAKL